MVRIVKDVVCVSPEVYDVIHDFLESSEEENEPWNIGCLLPQTHHAIFVKKGKWILNVCHRDALLFTYDYKQVFIYRYWIGPTVAVSLDSNVYQDVSANTFIVPYPPLSDYYIPIRIKDVVEKIFKYMKALEEAIKPDLSCRERC